MGERHSLAAAGRAGFPVSMMAGPPGVSRSGLHAWLSRGAAGDPWGVPRAEALRLRGSSEGRWGAPTAPSGPEGPFAGDATCPRTGEGWLYLATAVDLATRMVVGRSMSARNDSALVVSALERAWGRGHVAGGAASHGDRGSTYMGRALAGWAAGHDVRLSCGRTGCCRDNAVAESFFGTLKNEMYHLRAFATRREARDAVIDYVERYYNRARPHSTIGYQVPAERMRAFLARAEAAFSEEVEPLESAA